MTAGFMVRDGWSEERMFHVKHQALRLAFYIAWIAPDTDLICIIFYERESRAWPHAFRELHL